MAKGGWRRRRMRRAGENHISSPFPILRAFISIHKRITDFNISDFPPEL